MAAHSPLAHLFHRSSHPGGTRGHTLAAPRAYDAFVNFFFLGRRRATYDSLVRAADIAPGQRVLDVGCGTGYFARLLADAVGPAGLTIGVDASPEMIEYAARHRGRSGRCQFEVGTAESLSFPADHFDVVVSSLFMHHLPADLQPTAVAEMQRVLRPGGKLMIAEAQVPAARGWQLLARVHGYDRMARAVPELRRLMAEAGFEHVCRGEAPPWLQYVHGRKPARARADLQ